MMMPPSPPDSRRAVVTLTVTLALLAAWAWWQIPPWEREHLRAVGRSRARWLVGRLARLSARIAMGEELRTGHPGPVEWRYRLTHKLTRLSDPRGDTLP